jgi:hypothetical protein
MKRAALGVFLLGIGVGQLGLSLPFQGRGGEGIVELLARWEWSAA